MVSRKQGVIFSVVVEREHIENTKHLINKDTEKKRAQNIEP